MFCKHIKKFNSILSAVALTIALSCPVFAIEEIKESAVLSLQDCVELALQNSPQINMYRNYALMAKSRVGQAKSDYFPTLSAGTGYFGQRDSHTKTGTNEYHSANASLNQLLFNFGKTNARINMQKFNQIAADYDVDNAIVQAVYNVKNAYYNVLAMQAYRDIQDANVKINERQYIRTKAFFEEGLKSKIDLVNAEVYLSDSKIELTRAENNLKTAMIKLNNSMFVAYAPEYTIKSTESFNFTNTDYASISLLADNPDEKYAEIDKEDGTVFTSSVEKTDILQDYQFKPYPYSLEDAITRANENRPDLSSFASAYVAMEEALKYTKREYFPDLTGRVGYTMRNTHEYVNNGLTFAASLDFPAVNIMNTKYRIDESKAQLDVALDNLNLCKQNIYFEVQTAYVNMKQLEKQIPLLEVKVRQTLENYELADGRYAVGLGNFIELQDAKQNYNNAQQSYVRTIFDYNLAIATLEKAMGDR